MSTTTGWDLDAIGRWSEPTAFEVTQERMVAYAEATNDEHPLHASGELASPIFTIVPVFDTAMTPIKDLVPDDVLMRVVHGEQDIRFHAPIRAGQTLLSKGAVVGVHGRSSGTVVIAKATSETDGGDLVAEHFLTAFFRGVELDVSEGDPVTEHGFPEALRDTDPAHAVTHSYDEDQTFRYSKASGDPMPIHLDDAFAKKMGLPGIIVHGMCTMAFASRAVVQAACNEDPTRLKRIAVRFANIVQPSEQVTTSVWDAGEGRYAFETVSDTGKTAIKDGLAEVA